MKNFGILSHASAFKVTMFVVAFSLQAMTVGQAQGQPQQSPTGSASKNESDSPLAGQAQRELLGRNFKLLEANIQVNRVTIASQKKLAKVYAQTQGEQRELVSSALGEIMAMPRLNAVCNKQQAKANLAYRGTSMMYESISFVFKPAREPQENCGQLSIREIEMKPLELTGKTLKLAVSFDHVTTRNATCDIASVDGMWSLWKDVSAHCTLADGEGTFTLDID